MNVAQDNGHKELAEYLDKLHHRWVVIRSAIIIMFVSFNLCFIYSLCLKLQYILCYYKGGTRREYYPYTRVGQEWVCPSGSGPITQCYKGILNVAD